MPFFGKRDNFSLHRMTLVASAIVFEREAWRLLTKSKRGYQNKQCRQLAPGSPPRRKSIQGHDDFGITSSNFLVILKSQFKNTN